MKFVAPCLLGLEGIAANELRHLEIENVTAENGRVLFEGGFDTMARANICSRYAQRVLILLGEFEARDFETLFEGVKALPWSDFIGEKDAFPVKGSCVSSELSSVPACQKIVKKAVVESLRARYHTEWFEESGGVRQIQFLLLKNRVSVMLDTSGEPLNKRGWRAQSNDAPIRETLAAAMVELSRVRENHIVVDPFCGSGTILIEAALKAMRIMPGVNRSFAFESWEQIPAEIAESERERARAGERRDVSFFAYGYDIDENALSVARHNAQIAGVADKIVFKKRDIADFSEDYDACTVITNPPYGERMLDVKEARALYQTMGKVFLRKPRHSYTVISPDEAFESFFGRLADKKRKLYNGMLKCNVYMYFK
ncbi:MAG: class I SAM-dependent RNA methyltransferase [Ruminococcus sp.]|nr:class I SAM-dependent RNA methyltransferase [Ruminococcus sp.]